MTSDDRHGHPSLRRPWLTVPEVAELLGISEAAVYQRILRGSLPATRFGRSIRLPAVYFDA